DADPSVPSSCHCISPLFSAILPRAASRRSVILYMIAHFEAIVMLRIHIPRSMPAPRPRAKQKAAPVCTEAAACRKSPPAASFSEYLHCFPLGSMSLPGGKQRKETLLRKACESAAHVAGFGLHLEG